MIQDKTSKIPPNPFDVEDKAKVWKHFLENSKPISKAEALKKMKEASEMQKKSNRSSATSLD
jgi:hypothetical protein